jgi:hypothetical protein
MWRYTLVSWDPATDGPEHEWARKLAAEGWQMWDAGSGPWVEVNGRRVVRWSLRRWEGPGQSASQAGVQ